MLTTVDLSLLLEEQQKAEPQYAPVPGTLYQIAETGFTVRLLPPTMARVEQYDALLFDQGETYDAYKAEHSVDTVPFRVQLQTVKAIVQAVTEPVKGGEWPDDDSVFVNVLMRIGQDFLRSSRRIYAPATTLSPQQGQLMTDLLSKLLGQANGSAAKVGAT